MIFKLVVDNERIELSTNMFGLQTFGHFFSIDKEVFGVEPEAGEGLSRAPFRLSDLIFVVGEHIIDAAAVNIDGLAEVFDRHCRALDVPPGAPLAPRTLPVDCPVPLFIIGFPKDKVTRCVFFVLIVKDTL